MEIEYKWDMPSKAMLKRLCDFLAKGHVALREKDGACCDDSAHGQSRREAPGLAASIIHMHATYYDTPAEDVRKMQGGLRMRREGDESICCLKLAASGNDACKSRQEFEVAAPGIIEGLELLPSVGAPRDVCDRLLDAGPQPICETEFERRAYSLEQGAFSAELAVDVGEMRRLGRSAPIAELELEFKGGSREDFHAFAHELASSFDLVPQPLSKLARAMAL